MLMPTHLTTDEIAKVAHLSRLKLTSAEQQQATKQLDSILGHFAAIQKIDTANVPPADDVTGLHNITRRDQAQPVQERRLRHHATLRPRVLADHRHSGSFRRRTPRSTHPTLRKVQRR